MGHPLPVSTPFHSLFVRAGLALIAILLSFSAWGEVSLFERYHRLKDGLSATLPGTLIGMTSTEQEGVLSAEISSILPYPFETVSSALATAENWCHFMPLHFNIKACTYETPAGQTLLTLYSGRKSYQSPAESFQMAYHFDTLHRDDRRLALQLHAERGPAKTRDYVIEIDTMSVEEGTMLHIHSSYRPSLLSSLLTRTYLNTLGRNKVGFSRVTQDDEAPLVQGIRGVVERNVMRYHMAIAAYLHSQPLAESARHEAALANWFGQNDSYPAQLHEMEQSEYLTIKRQEWQNQRRLQVTLNAEIQLAEIPVEDAL